MNCLAIRRYAGMGQSKPTSQTGSVVIEFAFILVVMLLIVAGVIGFGRAYWYADALTKSTRDGARLLSMWPIANLATMDVGGRNQAHTVTINSANAANLDPQLVNGNVVVECLNSAFVVIGNCGTLDGNLKPIMANVRVRITGFSLNLSEWFPFVGGQAFGSVDFSPATTMRYMN